MNHELQRVEEKKVGQGPTELSDGFMKSSDSLFKGDNFSNVAEIGASAALVSEPPRAMNSLRVLSLLQVQNTLTKLHILAPSYRQLMPLRPVTMPLAASNEKTISNVSSPILGGDEFLSDVAETGASAALVSEPPRAMNSLRVLSLLQARNTLTKLHILAPSYRQLMPPRPVTMPLAASNKKTISKAPPPISGGDEFLSDVAETGASAALVSEPPRAMNSLRVLSLLQVQNTLTKLHILAPSYRQLMPLRPEWN